MSRIVEAEQFLQIKFCNLLGSISRENLVLPIKKQKHFLGQPRGERMIGSKGGPA